MSSDLSSTTLSQDTKSPTDEPLSRMYNIVIIIVSGMIFGILIANCVYYHKVKVDAGIDISAKNANIMMWFNAIMAIAAGIIFVWSILKIALHKSVITATHTYLNKPSEGFVTYVPQVSQPPMAAYVSNVAPQQIPQVPRYTQALAAQTTAPASYTAQTTAPASYAGPAIQMAANPQLYDPAMTQMYNAGIQAPAQMYASGVSMQAPNLGITNRGAMSYSAPGAYSSQ